ncbi:hypothetical protein BST42_27045 [Mycolicibacterium rhodesiae]|uniref:Phage capsid-like C-terminal domain-containing protein n=1 Tax=Mycolicibacterium rhodesiae TaxID=36814 RepID=A0A1X0IJ53_MYCRH|nr:hypothetical protein BST42_27045 [Mycolicibacterium rhodesiae]
MVGQLSMLRDRRIELRDLLDQHLERAKRDGRENMLPREKAILGELRQLDQRIKEQEAEVERAGSIPQFGQPGRAGAGRSLTTAGQLSPLAFPDQELRRLQVAAQRGEGARIESRDFSTADPLLPSQLFPYPVSAIHESRLLDRLPGYAIETPSVTFIRHVSTTGAPAATAEGGLKPEVIFNVDSLTATAVKLAAHNGLSWEIINDWPAFQSYCGTELYRQLIDVENEELIQGNAGAEFTGTTVGAGPSGMNGFMSTPGILTHDAAGDTGTAVTSLDSIEIAIARMRTGPALAVPDLLVLNPETWSAVRRTKDLYGRFLVQPDPTTGEANELWGIPVLQTTQQPAGYGLLIDTSEFGYVAVREPLSMRIGYSGDDLVHNILRTVCEERLVLCVTRPPAIMLVSGLPT